MEFPFDLLLTILVTLAVIGTWTLSPILTGSSRPLPGDKAAFDPLLHKKLILDFAQLPEGYITGFEARNVPASGLMDYSRGNSPPIKIEIGDLGSDSPTGSYSQVSITFSANHFSNKSYYRNRTNRSNAVHFHLGMNKSKIKQIKQKSPGSIWPTCSLKDVWDTALQHGADPLTPAHITYGKKGFKFRCGEFKLGLDSSGRTLWIGGRNKIPIG